MSHTTIAFLLAALSLAGSTAFAADAPAKVADLRCEYLINPQGIDEARPRLSWQMEAAARGQRQTAYQVIVASSPDLLASDRGDDWDSGKVPTDQSINIEYAGAPLATGARCYWKVRDWDMDGQPTPWSEPANWSMGLLNSDDWKAGWIGLNAPIADDRFAVLNLDGVQWIWSKPTAEKGKARFRRRIDLPDSAIKSAGMVIFGEDDFTLWINGRQVAHRTKSLRPVALDVTKYLTPGRNEIAVEAEIQTTRAFPGGLAARLMVTPQGGSPLEWTTDSSWLTTTQEQSDWTQALFDDSSWTPAATPGRVFAGDQRHRWIWVPDSAPAHYLRKEFVADRPIQRATAYVSGLGWFELHINGQKIGDHVLDPVVSEYEKRAYAVTFDVTDAIKQGNNAVGVILGLGRYCDMRLRLQVNVEYEGGGSVTWISDPSWKGTDRGPIVSNSEYDGETYDAGREMPGWDQPGFDDSHWQSVEARNMPDVVMSAQMVEPIRVTGTIQPVAMTNPRPGVFVFDMGQNMVGWCRLHVAGPAGTRVQLRHAETLQADGMIYVANLRTAKATDEYVLKGGGPETYEPRFTYHGFRFVELTGYPGAPDLSTLQGRVVNNDLDESAGFECASALLNQIRRNIAWGVRGNYNGVPTDCPQRNERLGWLGDRGAECVGESYVFNIAALYQKWMGDMRDGQTPAGSVSDTAPGNLHNDGVVWPSTYILAADLLHQQYDDVRAITDHYDAMKKWIVFTNGFLADGILTRNTYGDWCVPPESATLIHSRDPLRQTDGGLLSTAYFYHDLRVMAGIAALLGKSDDAARFTQQAEAMKSAFNRKFYDQQAGQYLNGSQTSSVLPLAFGLVPGDQRSRVFGDLVQKIQQQNKDHLGTGLVGGQFLMRVLSDNGRADLAFTIATQTTYPSWGYMVGKGATTIWELWNGDTADPAMNSGNHVMLVGDLNIWLQEYVAGISPDENSPGWKHFEIHPRLCAQLDWARGNYQSPYGRISCDWSHAGGGLALNVTVPANSTATVFVPAKSADAVSVDDPAGVKFTAIQNGQAVYEVASGTFAFKSN